MGLSQDDQPSNGPEPRANKAVPDLSAALRISIHEARERPSDSADVNSQHGQWPIAAPTVRTTAKGTGLKKFAIGFGAGLFVLAVLSAAFVLGRQGRRSSIDQSAGGAGAIQQLGSGTVAKSLSTPAPAQPTLPDGWKTFETSIFTGAANNDWPSVNTDLGSLVDTNDPDYAKLPLVIRQQLEANKDLLKDTTVLYLDLDPTYATNIEVGSCLGPPSDLGLLLRSNPTRPDVVVQAYKVSGLDVEFIQAVATRDGQAPIVKFVAPGVPFDSYQALLIGKTCYSSVVLATRPGDTAPLASFEQFLAYLRFK